MSIESFGQEAINHLKDEGVDIDLRNPELEDLIQTFIEADDLIISDLMKPNEGDVEFWEYDHLMALHLWHGRIEQRDDKKAIFALVDFKTSVEETAFLAQGGVAEEIESIFSQIRKESAVLLSPPHEHTPDDSAPDSDSMLPGN